VTGRLPFELLGNVLRALRDVGVEPVVIGSLAALEHLDDAAAEVIATEDVDLLLQLERAELVDAVVGAMEGLGLRRPKGREGKWLPPGDSVGVDLLSRNVPSGFGAPACLEEPFANVAALDIGPPHNLARRVPLPAEHRPKTIGPLTTIMGKSLKVSRYLGLDDWPSNANRRSRARRSMWIAAALIQQNPDAFPAAGLSELTARAEAAGGPVPTTLERGVDAMLSLFGHEEGTGIRLARDGGPDGIWNPREVVATLDALR
jgi:hypothetical protein